MNTNKQGTIPNQPSAHFQHTGSGQDEISLLDIWQALKRQWRLICAITFSVTLVALIVALMMPKFYRAEVVLLPPLESDVEVLNIPELYEITADDLYQEMIRNLQSNELRYQFFKEHKLFASLKGEENTESDSYKVFQNKFSSLMMVKVSYIKNKKTDIVTVSLDGVNYEQITPWINKYVAFVDVITAQSIFSAIESKLRVLKSNIHMKMDSLRLVAEKRRLDLIAQLNEALVVADKLGIDERDSIMPSYVNNQSEKDDLGIVLNTVENPVYTRGSKALTAEIEVLKNRKSDDPFIPGLRELEEKLSFLENVDLENKNVHAVRIDQSAIPDDIPIKPKRKLIVTLGFVFGVFLAFFSALVRNLVVNAEVSKETS